MGCVYSTNDGASVSPSKEQASQCVPCSEDHCYGRSTFKCPAPSLGVLRLDDDYPVAKGDIDSPSTFPFDVVYRVVPGLTFEVCRSGKLSPEMQKRFVDAVKWLDTKKVSAISGDCGFMLHYQALARRYTHRPVFLSSLLQLGTIRQAFNKHDKIAIFTADSKALQAMSKRVWEECGVDILKDKRYVVVGCEDLEAFKAVAKGTKLNLQKAQEELVRKACNLVQTHHPGTFRAFCFECTQMPPFSDAVRHATGVPVFDIVTCCNFFVSSMRDNERFGLARWQHRWDHKQEKYVYEFGANLSPQEEQQLIRNSERLPPTQKTTNAMPSGSSNRPAPKVTGASAPQQPAPNAKSAKPPQTAKATGVQRASKVKKPGLPVKKAPPPPQAQQKNIKTSKPAVKTTKVPPRTKSAGQAIGKLPAK